LVKRIPSNSTLGDQNFLLFLSKPTMRNYFSRPILGGGGKVQKTSKMAILAYTLPGTKTTLRPKNMASGMVS